MRAWLAVPTAIFFFAASPATVPDVHRVAFDLVDNRIFVSCTIDGVPGFALIFDTGATGMLPTPEAAARIHARTSAEKALTGAGSGSLPSSQTSVNDVSLAGVHLGKTRTDVADLGAIRRGIGFTRLDGILGYDLLEHFALRIDMDHRVMTLSPEPVGVPASARTTAYALWQNFMEVPMSVDGRKGKVILDMGDRSSLTLFEPFAERNGFYQKVPIVRNALTGFGVGGPIFADVFRTQLDAVGYSVANVITRAPQRHTGGFFAISQQDGSIGTGFLRRFNMVFDFPKHRLIVWPSTQFERNDRYDPTGMWISAGTDGPTVTAVTAGGSAARAGIRTGETIVAINGENTRAWSPLQLRSWFSARPDGESIAITLQSASGATVTRTLTPRDVLSARD